MVAGIGGGPGRQVRCQHLAVVTTITAGLARRVCQVCSHVSVEYVESAIQTYPNLTLDLPAAEQLLECDFCGNVAIYRIPGGTVCDGHAWEMASGIDWQSEPGWVPMLLQ